MKNFLLFFATVYSVICSAQSFEGAVTMIPDFITKPGNKEKVIFYVKGDKVAMEPTGTGPMNGRIIGSSTTKEYCMLMNADGKKIALNMNMDKMMEMFAGTAPGVTAQGQGNGQPDQHLVQPTIRETGATRTIDGFTCTQVFVEMNGEKSELWVTRDINLSLGDFLFNPAMGARFKNYDGLKGMVLEAWHYNAKGKITSSIKMKPVKAPIKDDVFEIPQGYEKMDLTQLMQAAKDHPEMMQQLQQMFSGQK